MATEHEFDVPQEAYDPKPWFNTREDANSALPEIREWMAAGNEPHLWRGHTHSRPPSSATPVYIGEFSLPAPRVRAKRWAACPCCSPRDPKFGDKPGKVAWFPEECVIRLMGPDCFRSLNQAGHEAALADFLELKRQVRDEVFLLGNLDKVSPALEVLKAGRTVAEQLEQLKASLAYPMQLYGSGLWQHIRTGTLNLHKTEQQVFRAKDGELHQRPVETQTRYASIPIAFFDPNLNRLSPRFTAVIEKLEEIDFPNPKRALDQMPEEERVRAAKALGKSFERGRDLLQQLADWRACLSRSTLGTLRSWGQHPDGPIRFYIRREAWELIIGSHPNRTITVTLPYFVDRIVGEIPKLTGSDITQPIPVALNSAAR